MINCNVAIEQIKGNKQLKILNHYEIQKLKSNFERIKKETEFKDKDFKIQIETFTGCYFLFTPYKMLIYKFKNNIWYRKEINHWKIFNCDEFLELLNMIEWKIL